MSKKNNKDENLEKNVLLQSWDKLEYLQKRLDSRSKDFYIKTSFFYTRLSFFLVFICFVCLGFQFYKVHQLKIEKGYYISGIEGRIYNIKMNEDKYNKMMNALNEYRDQQNKANQVAK